MEEPKSSRPEVSLVAAAQPPAAHHPESGASPGEEHDSFYKSAEWSSDGTTVFASSADNSIHTYVLPEDLLEPREDAISLKPRGILTLPEPTAAIAAAPYFSLSHGSTHAILVACNDHPIQLHHCLPSDATGSPDSLSSPQPLPTDQASRSTVLATYPLIKPTTEAYLPPRALLWPSPGTHFLTGTQNLLALFDITRPGPPITRIPTIPSTRHLAKGSGVGMRGTVSALSIQPSSNSTNDATGGGLVAAGTWTRWVGLYDLSRAGGPGACAATWSVASAADAPPSLGRNQEPDGAGSGAGGVGIGGKGIMQTAWSPCGRYLIINERRSQGLLLYDVRVTGRLLGALAGRDGDTNQRLNCGVFAAGAMHSDGATAAGGEGGGGGFEVWAGDVRGVVHVWEGVGGGEGLIRPSWSWKAHSSPVGEVSVHMSGSVVASCSGSWTLTGETGHICFAESPESDASESAVSTHETSLNIWSIGGTS